MSEKPNPYEVTSYDFMNHVLIHCPKCNQQAQVRTNRERFREAIYSEIWVTCVHCGMNKRFSELPHETSRDGYRLVAHNSFAINTTVDPYFKYPLWLVKEVAEGTIWAYNYKHLDLLEDHVSSKLRERNLTEIHNKSIGSRLPRWMTSKQNRASILKSIDSLRTKLG